jgi:hypothetical protein
VCCELRKLMRAYNSIRQTDRLDQAGQTNRQTDRQTDRRTDRLILLIRAPIESNRIEFLYIRFDYIRSNLYISSIRSNIRSNRTPVTKNHVLRLKKSSQSQETTFEFNEYYTKIKKNDMY